MATHDYIISNASGASVRADLNNALAAIVSNNSNATSPATTYAYQWWADTTTGQLKLRNSANSAWITIFELDGTMLMLDGSLAAPGLAFASDLDTGFSRTAANTINFSTGGAERLEISNSEVVFNDPSNDVDFRVESNTKSHMLFVDAGNDRVGIGTSSPGRQLEINGDSDTQIRVVAAAGGFAGIQFGDANDSVMGGVQFDASDDSLQLRGFNNSEALRIDTSGRLLLGTTSPIDSLSLSNSFHLKHSNGPEIYFLRDDSGSTVAGNAIGMIKFYGNDNDGTAQECARIEVEADLDHGNNDKPGRLLFMTTADGASSPTERVRIDSSGRMLVGLSSVSDGHRGKVVTRNDVDYTSTEFEDDATLLLQNEYNNNSAVLVFHSNNSAGSSGRSAIVGGTVNNGKGKLGFYGSCINKDSTTDADITIDADGRLLIGVTSSYASSNADDLQVGDNSASAQSGITLGSTVLSSLRFADAGGDSQGVISYMHSDDSMRFFTGGSERLRVDSSGQLGIGTTSPARLLEVVDSQAGELVAARFTNNRDVGTDVVSVAFGLARSGGFIHEAAKIKVIKDQAFTATPSTVDAAMTFEVIKDENRFETVRLKSNGEMTLTLAGGDKFRIGGGTNHSIFRDGKCGIHWTTAALLPTNGSGTINDNVMDIGEISHRFDDIYATNGTIQTSDQTLKQDVAALSTAEIAVAKRIRGLVKTYRWIDAVEAKGDDARIHCGVIAQEVEQAFTDEGLDVNRYALFCKNTWYEVDGVSLTKDGPVTADDEGAVEVTRRGVRYPELLAFVMAGVNAEMADVTSRLAALEAA